MAKDKATLAEKELSLKSKPPEAPTEKDYLSTGVTLINLALHGRTDGAVLKGRCYRVNGRPSGGKTFLCRTILAEAAANPNFRNYELVYDDVERGALMDTEKFFGKALVERLRPPAYVKGSKRPWYSRTAREFYERCRKRMEAGRSVIWVVDSLDSLEGEGTNKMTDNKAKIHSQELRRLGEPMEATGSIVVLVSQSRVNIGASPFEEEDITAGGRALEHYPSADIQLRKAKSLRKTYKGKNMITGSVIRARVKKNRISGKDHTVFFPFYPSSGIDDTGSCVNYLLEMKHWKSGKAGEDDGEEYDPLGKEVKSVVAPEFDYEGSVEKLIEMIEDNNERRELQILVGKTWKEAEDACTPKRKPRYL